MEDEAPKRKIRPQRVKAKSPSKKDIDDDFKLKKIVVENSEVRRNPKRQVGLKNYEEIEEPQDDRYIYCDFCENVFVDNCNKCGQLAVLQNIEVEMGVENRAKLTIPKTSLIILPSPIHGLGVFAKVPLKKGVKMGPYEGTITRLETSTGYSWKLRDGRLVDAADEKFSNWLRYVNCARHFKEQNLVAFQYKGNLFYRTCRDIKIGEELLVYYGQSFANLLGIDIKNYFQPKEENMTEDPKICSYCNFAYKDLVKLKVHMDRCKWNPANAKENPEFVFYCRFCPLGMADEEFFKKHEITCEKRQKQKKEKGSSVAIERTKKENSRKKGTRYQCQKCGYSSYDKTNFHRHENIHSKVFKFICGICQKGFTSPDSMKKHMYHHLNEATNKTTLQTAKVFDENATRTKIRAELSGVEFDVLKYECSKCDYFTSNSDRMKNHVNSHKKVLVLSCVLCQLECRELKELQSHLKECLRNEGEQSCEGCEKSVFCEIHMRKVLKNETGHVCGICGYCSIERGTLKRHILAVHLQMRNYRRMKNEKDQKKENNAVGKNKKGNSSEKVKRYQCEKCDYSSYCKASLRTHENTHSKVFKFICKICQKGYSSQSALRQHMNQHLNEATNARTLQTTKLFGGNATRCEIRAELHGVEFDVIKFDCLNCNYVTSNSVSMKNHISTHNKISVFGCISCEFESGGLEDLQSHLKECHRNKERSCEGCEKGVFCEIHMMKITRNDTGHVCGICGKSIATKFNLKIHVSTVHLQKKNYKCTKCDRSFPHMSNLKTHVASVHLREKNYKCKYCNYSAFRKEGLKQHTEAVHLRMKPHKCKFCDYTAGFIGSLNAHMEALHNENGRFYKCDKCDFVSKYKHNLTQHNKNVHLKEKNFICKDCNYSCTHRARMKAHIKTVHLKERTFRCEECDHVSSTSGNLTKHVKIVHSKRETHKCPVCGYVFNHKTLLRKHTKLFHSKIVEFECYHCGFKTDLKATLEKHISAKHLKSRDFKCRYCEYAANHEETLMIHVQVKHSEEVDSEEELLEKWEDEWE